MVKCHDGVHSCMPIENIGNGLLQCNITLLIISYIYSIVKNMVSPHYITHFSYFRL